jgi:hypothetical protein
MPLIASRTAALSFAATIALALSACETTQPKQPSTATVEQDGIKSNGSAGYFVSEKMAYMDAYKAVVDAKCPATSPDLERCFNHAALVAFDVSGQGKIACREVDEVGSFAACVLAVSMVKTLDPQLDVMSLGLKPEMTWDSIWSSFKGKLVPAMSELSNRCSYGDSVRQMECTADEASKQLRTPPQRLQVCVARSQGDDRLLCVIEAYLVDLMRDGTNRLTQTTAL